MNWLVRLLICGVIAELAMLASQSRSGNLTGGKIQIHHAPSSVISSGHGNFFSIAVTAKDSRSVNNLVALSPFHEAGPEPSVDDYEVIAKRNIFALHSPPSPSFRAAPMSPPKEDLFLTGVCDLNSVSSALFMLAALGNPPFNFTLAEGEQNNWVEVLSVNTANNTVTVRLKKPVMRIRSVGVEVILPIRDYH